MVFLEILRIRAMKKNHFTARIRKVGTFKISECKKYVEAWSLSGQLTALYGRGGGGGGKKFNQRPEEARANAIGESAIKY